ncbi:MAG: restriction endonuclease subunit S [Burkholderiaceae bacterium]
MLPKGWKHVRLGNIAQITSGGTPDRSEPCYWGEDIPWVTTGEIQFNTITDTLEKISHDGLNNSSAKLLPAGTLLMAMYGQGKTRGQVARLGIEAATNQACAAICVEDNVDAEFVFQFLAANYNAIRELGNAGTQQNLNAGLIKGIDLVLPPRHEQIRIAKIASVWEAVIAVSEKLLANSRRQKEALSQILDWGGTRLNSRRGKAMRRHASELFAPISIRRNENAELLSVTQEQGVIPRRLLDRKVVMPEGATDSYKLVEPGDFVISLRSFEGGLEYSKFRGLVSPAYTVLRAKQPICDDFYRHYFKSKDFISRLSVAVIGIRDGKQISYDDFAFLKLQSPSIEVQQKVAAVLNEAERELELLTSHLEALKAEKRALMADLLSGKRRVRVPDSIAEPEAA